MNYEVIKSAEKVRLNWRVKGFVPKYAYFEPTINGLEKLKIKLGKIKEKSIIPPMPALYLKTHGRWTRFCPAVWDETFIDSFIRVLQ